MRDSVFKLSYFLSANEKFHIARVNITSSQDLSLHSHDYAEILWVEKGTGIHYVNGHQFRLSPGDLIMVRPKDRHTFSSSGKGIVIVNVAFPVETLDYFRQRYFEWSNLYFWTTGMFPFQMRLSRDIVKRLSSRAEEAMKYGRSNIVCCFSFSGRLRLMKRWKILQRYRFGYSMLFKNSIVRNFLFRELRGSSLYVTVISIM